MPAKSAKFDVGLDRSTTMTKDESERLANWYKEAHGAGNLDLVGFVTFLTEHRPDIMKRHRFVAEAKTRAQQIGSLANVLIFLHYYTVIANPEGILYEIIAVKKWGGTRQEVLDTIAYAYLHGGTNGLNAVAKLSLPLLREWTSDERESKTSPWPEGWASDPAALRAGLDETVQTLTDTDRQRLAEWYRAVGSEEPAYVRLLAKYRPEVLKEWRGIQEATIVSSLPKQIVPLYLLHLSVIRANPAGIRLAANQAQAFGVTREQALDAICWGMSNAGETGLVAVGDLLYEIVEGWPAAPAAKK